MQEQGQSLWYLVGRWVLATLALSASGWVTAELKPEPIPNIEKLAVPYPPTYAVVHDFAFGSLIDSSFGLVDTATRRFKGMFSAGQFATIDHSVARREFYIGETLHSHGSRGQRQDLITVYDFENLDIVKEIKLPPKRMNAVITAKMLPGRPMLPARSSAKISMSRSSSV